MANNPNNNFEKFSDAYDKSKQALKSGFVNFMNYIMLFFLIVFVIFSACFILGFQILTDWNYWVNSILMVVIGLFSFAIFIPQGEQNEKIKSTSYFPNCTTLSKLTKKMKDEKKLNAFNQYVHSLTEKRKQLKLESYLDKAGVDKDIFEKEFKGKRLEDVKKWYKETNHLCLNKNQFSWFKKCFKKIKVKELNPMRVLTGSNTKDPYAVAENKGISYVQKSIVQKAVVSILSTVVMASITVSLSAAGGWVLAFLIIMRITTVIMSTFLGFWTGKQNIRKKDENVKDRIIFIQTFFEVENVDFKEENGNEKANS